MLGIPGGVGLHEVFGAFAEAGVGSVAQHPGDLWPRTHALGGADPVLAPHLPALSVGSILPGVLCSLAFYWLTIPVLTAYQALRRRRIAARYLALRKKVAAKEGDGPTINP